MRVEGSVSPAKFDVVLVEMTVSMQVSTKIGSWLYPSCSNIKPLQSISSGAVRTGAFWVMFAIYLTSDRPNLGISAIWKGISLGSESCNAS